MMQRVIFLWFCLSSLALAAAVPNQVNLRVDLFLSTTCPHCEKMDNFFKSMETSNTWLDVHRHMINEGKDELDAYQALLQRLNMDTNFAVPAAFFCNSGWVGFNKTTSAERLWKNLQYCRAQIIKEGQLSENTVQALQKMSNASWYGEHLVTTLGATAFIPLIAMLDVINPVTTFIILSLFSLIRIEKSRQWPGMLSLFFLLGVIVSHAWHESISAYFYQSLGLMRWPAAIIGLAMLTYVWHFHNHSAESKRPLPGFLSCIELFLTGFVVQIYALGYAPNFSLMFHQWRIVQQFQPHQHVLYRIFYQIMYIAAVCLIAYILSVMIDYYGKWSKHDRVVNEFAWYYLAMIGLMLLLYPYGFANVWFAFASFILVLVVSWLRFQFKK